VRPLALDDFAGIAFRYATNRHYYLFALTGGTQARLAVRQPIDKTLRVAEWRELASAPFTYDTKSYYKVVLWDRERVWIYTQDGPAPRGRLYAPVRNPHYNDSNYRAHVSWPRWVDAPAR